MKKKEKEKDIKQITNFIDKQIVYPCRICRKRNSCFIIKPKDEKCTGLEEGTPWEY